MRPWPFAVGVSASLSLIACGGDVVVDQPGEPSSSGISSAGSTDDASSVAGATSAAASSGGSTDGWHASQFEPVPAHSACSGERYVTWFPKYAKFVGAVLCTPHRYKLFMAETEADVFFEIADGSGHGQDHCELVNPAFTMPDDGDITSGGCFECAVGEAFVTAVIGEGYTRSKFGEQFTFESPMNSLNYTPDWYECGVSIP